MANEILAEQNEFKETIMTKMAEFEQYRVESERRNRSMKSFATNLGEFLGDTKFKLLKMITQFDEAESQRLGPLMPAGTVTLESFGVLADTFLQGSMALIEEAAQHWQIKGAAQVQEEARKLEA